ncbi:MAG TPA: DUF4158 domain-containing protein, partial [Oleiagrimonas sp.]|nr:DUF4158 domain-containing protein [Oleiagrimonas sp.]
MTTLHETAYPRIKANLTAAELRDVYTPSEAELAWAGQVAQSLVTRLAVLVHLKLSQRLGRFIPLSEVPAQIIRHVAHAAGYGRVPAAEKLASYDASGAKRAHVAKIRKFRGVHPFKP